MTERARGPLAGGQMRLTLRGWGFAVAAVVTYVVASIMSNRDLLLLGCLLAALLIASLIHVHLKRASLEIFRSFSPDVVPVDSSCVVVVEVRNLSKRAADAAQCRDENGLNQPSPELDLRALGPAGGPRSRSESTLKYTLTPTQRGLHPIGPLVVRTADLLGLAFWDRRFGRPQLLPVAPRVHPLDADHTSTGPDGAMDAARLTSAGGADDTLPREYRTGDAMRRVHWRATARYGDLMVRQDEQQDDPECWILLDNRLAHHNLSLRRIGTGSRGMTSASFEWAVSMAASIAVHAQQEGYLARITRTADETPGESTVRIDGDHDVLLDLAGVALVGGHADPGYVRELAGALRSHGGGGPLFAVLGDIGEDEAELLGVVTAFAHAPTAFVVDGSEAARATLIQHGWRCVAVSPDDDVRAAWSDAASLSRSAHASG